VACCRKKKYRTPLSDLVGTYGSGVLGRPLTGEERYGLWLLRERVRLQWASAVTSGILAALTSGPLSHSWFDAQANAEEEVDFLRWRVNSERAETRLRRRKR
jgi:hypothetical protein